MNESTVTKPWTVKIELTEGCNLMCPFCGIHSIRKKAGSYKLMNIKTANIVADDIAYFCPTARIEIEGHGEPLLNPKYIEILFILRSALPKTQIQVTSNGMILKNKMADKIPEILSLVDFMILDTYKINRDWMRKEVSDLSGVNVIDYFSPDNKISPYANFHRKLRNTIFLMDDLLMHSGEKKTRSLHNSAGNNPMIGPVPEPLHKTCTTPYREAFICHDGFIPLCCLDFGREFKAGNIYDKSLYDIWLGPRMEAVRKVLSIRYRGFSPCSRCSKKAGHRVGLLPKYQAPSFIDVGNIAKALVHGDRLNNQKIFIDPCLYRLVKGRD